MARPISGGRSSPESWRRRARLDPMLVVLAMFGVIGCASSTPLWSEDLPSLTATDSSLRGLRVRLDRRLVAHYPGRPEEPDPNDRTLGPETSTRETMRTIVTRRAMGAVLFFEARPQGDRLWVTFDLHCETLECGWEFVSLPDGSLALAAVPDYEHFGPPQVYRGRVRPGTAMQPSPSGAAVPALRTNNGKHIRLRRVAPRRQPADEDFRLR